MNISLYNHLILNLIKYRFIVNTNTLLTWSVGRLEIFRKTHVCFLWLYKVYTILALRILWIFSCNLKKYIYMPFKFHYDTSKCYSLSRDCFSTVFKTHIRSIYIVFDGHCLELLHFSKSISLSIC